MTETLPTFIPASKLGLPTERGANVPPYIYLSTNRVTGRREFTTRPEGAAPILYEAQFHKKQKTLLGYHYGSHKDQDIGAPNDFEAAKAEEIKKPYTTPDHIKVRNALAVIAIPGTILCSLGALAANYLSQPGNEGLAAATVATIGTLTIGAIRLYRQLIRNSDAKWAREHQA